MATPAQPATCTREEVLALLSAKARDGHVGAMRLLLAQPELGGTGDAPGIIDELSRRRRRSGPATG